MFIMAKNSVYDGSFSEGLHEANDQNYPAIPIVLALGQRGVCYLLHFSKSKNSAIPIYIFKVFVDGFVFPSYGEIPLDIQIHRSVHFHTHPRYRGID